MAKPQRGFRFRFRREWPWVIAVAAIAGAIFFHPWSTPATSTARSATGLRTQGRGRYANAGLSNDGGMVK